MVNEYTRTERLIGTEKLQKLREQSVLVFGIGGVGSHCIEALARSGVGRLILVDHDTVSVTNINRQSIAYHSTAGQYKTTVMKQRIQDICPDIEVITHEIFVLPEQVKELIKGSRPDYIIDAIDTVAAKLAIAEEAIGAGIPVISCMGTGNKLNAGLFEITDISKTSVCPLCKVMRKELRNRGILHLKVLYSKETPSAVFQTEAQEEVNGKRSVPGSISFVPPVAGLLIAGEVIRDIIGIEE